MDSEKLHSYIRETSLMRLLFSPHIEYGSSILLVKSVGEEYISAYPNDYNVHNNKWDFKRHTLSGVARVHTARGGS